MISRHASQHQGNSSEVAVESPPGNTAPQTRVLYIGNGVGRTASGKPLMDINTIADGQAGLRAALRGGDSYSAILLDFFMLQNLDGLSIIRSLVAAGNSTPIIVSSAPEDIERRIDALSAGADDYIISPFTADELWHRVETLALRKRNRNSATITIADLTIDPVKQIARRDGQIINLSRREFRLLHFLAVRRGEIVSRKIIFGSLYAGDSHSNVIDVYVGYLRKKLNAHGRANLIHTRRGFGYFLSDQGGMS